MLANTASECESDESVVSGKSKKRVERSESGGLVIVSCLTGIGFPPQLRALHENFIHPWKIYEELYYEAPYKNLIKNPQI